MKLLTDEKRKKWCDLLAELDMKRSSKKAWDLIKRLNNDPTQKPTIPIVTPIQIAHNLLMNGKIKVKKPRMPKPKIKRRKENENMGLLGTFLDIELEAAIKTLKNGKAAGIDDMSPEQIQDKNMAIRPL